MTRVKPGDIRAKAPLAHVNHRSIALQAAAAGEWDILSGRKRGRVPRAHHRSETAAAVVTAHVTTLKEPREVTDETERVTETETTEANIGSPPQDIVRMGGTFEAFRHRAYALFWSGAVVSNIGTWMQNYALGIVVYSFRSSSLDLGLVNFLAGIPTLLLAIPLNSAQFQSARLLGPLIAGAMVVAGAGMGEIFWVNAGSFLFV